MMDVNDIIKVMNAQNEKASSLSLSKGGFEGWLQAELWYHLNIIKGESTEREVQYPHSLTYCDLVCDATMTKPAQWVEVKAYGIFRDGDEPRFLDGVAADVMKIDGKPADASGSVYLVVPKAISDKVEALIVRRGWTNFKRTDSVYAYIYYADV
ncbi:MULTISPECIES: hypothetical protein [Enterobacter]|jgi:hypothetical protein|uniref:Uncharacterized protein n=3 Tax=Enterobacter sichuanensis TaxID=2071710 RepID=A0ABS6G8D7_9ENTR|nr:MULTISPECIES: hypothetical protein [Enterobacter]MBO2933456.1 hypothetical protein [Enterobacter sichuanensis]MBU5923068.1 hypothetical protein [Enterobacter sichuanensis]MCA2027920.1 hypothetical protein [Enterobacter sp. K16B]MCI8902977.1 hypothetical protein [Enterobacter sp.]MEA5169795.1 hypothetical protein [Enterobacter sichuanensis]